MKSERLRILVAFLAIGIAVADADELAIARDVESDDVVGGGHETALFVEGLDGQDCNIFSVGVDLGAVGGELDSDRGAGSLALLRQNDFAVFAAARFNRAGFVPDLPLHVTKLRNLLAARGSCR